MKTCIKCSKEINEEMMYCPYCGEKQDSDDFLSNLDSSLSEQIETKITLENEQEKFKLFDYKKVADDTYIIKGLKNKYVYKVDIPEGVVAICEEAFANSKVIEVNLPNTLMEIEARAFKDCKLLKKINIPETLSVIGDEAFYNCVLLEVNYNNDNITFGNDVFVGTLTEKKIEEEAKRKEKEEAEKKALADKAAKEATEKAAKEKAAKEAAERKAKEEAAERKAKEEAEKKIKEEAERKAKDLEERIKILHKRKNEFDINAFLNDHTFGRYPQTLVTDINIINNLKQISIVNEYGYIEYEGNEYEEYSESYYLVEPIKWAIVGKNENSYKLVSDSILDYQVFYEYENKPKRKINGKKIYASNYEYSNIRAWLNGYDGRDYGVSDYRNFGFINKAFNKVEMNIIQTTTVDNSTASSGIYQKKYISNNTEDKIYLLNQDEAIHSPYAYGTGYPCYLRSIWLRNPIGEFEGVIFEVTSYDWQLYHVPMSYWRGVRPALEIKIK